MKLLHLSDLHIGKRVNEFSMLEDQEYILIRIINIVDEEKPDGIMIAGDIYDKSIPSAESVQLFDDFLVRLSARDIPVFVISGNHDSPERIAFGGRLMNRSGVYMAPVFDGNIVPVELKDEFGRVNVFMLPFVKPANVRRYYPESGIETYTDAAKTVIDDLTIDPAERNVLIAHQFVTGAVRCESEDVSVGGLDNVNADVFDVFDYVALGHIHSPQNIGKDTVRYCGTPLKYSFSEAGHQKSVTIAELSEKGKTAVRTVPLDPKRDMREIKGTYMDVTAREYYKDTDTEDYIHVTLTDEEDIPDAIGKLRSIYPNIMKLDYDNKRTRTNAGVSAAEDVQQRSPLELFEEFFEKQNNQKMTDEQKRFASGLIEKIWEDEA
jgi:DNA repair protein SbcD/Mre11